MKSPVPYNLLPLNGSNGQEYSTSSKMARPGIVSQGVYVYVVEYFPYEKLLAVRMRWWVCPG